MTPEMPMSPEEASDLSLRISALERVVERIASSARGDLAVLLSERRDELHALASDVETMADIKHAISFELVLLRGVVTP